MNKDYGLAEKGMHFSRLNTICPYFTMFPLQFPYQQLLRAKPGSWVLDPFCGRGTTNFAARLLQLPSIGVDSSPIAAAIARAKFVQTRPSDILRVAKAIISNHSPHDVPKGAFWRKCYHEATLKKLCVLREDLLRDCESPARVALRSIILGSLHGPVYSDPSYFSNQMPRTYATKPRAAINFWKKKQLSPRAVDLLGIIGKKARYFFSDTPPPVDGCVIQADSRRVASELARYRFDWVITSPPYLGMRTYVPDQWLRNWFLGGPALVDYTSKDQLGLEGKDNFISALAAVWREVTPLCKRGARLVIRFGALPSLRVDSRLVLRHSLDQAGHWRVLTIKNAGNSSRGKRQASQFVRPGRALDEIDLHAVLED